VYSDGNMIVPSIHLRGLVAAELEKRNKPTIAESYSGYRKKNMTSMREDPLHDGKLKQSLGINTHAKQFAKDKDNTSGRSSKIGYQG
jgi:transcriptional repressor NrdR